MRTINVRQDKTLPVKIVVILIILVIAGSVLAGVLRSVIPSSEMADLSVYYQASDGTAALTANGVMSSSRCLWQDGEPYLLYSIVKSELNDKFYWDQTEQLLLYTTPVEVIQSDASSVYQEHPVFLTKTDTSGTQQVYLSLNYISQYTNITVDSFSGPNRVFIRSSWGITRTASVPSGTALRTEAAVSSAILCKTTSAEQLRILSSENGWSRVYSARGYVGYVRDSELKGITETADSGPYQAPEYTTLAGGQKVCLVWHQVFHESGVDSLPGLLASTSGVTVVCPTWFSIVDNQGTIESRANKQYVTIAHSRGLSVWGLLENINSDVKLDNYTILSATSHRKAMISKLISEAQAVGLDGINVDLEGLPESAGNAYIEFIRELSVACRTNGLMLSVDNYVPSAWTRFYNRDKQAEVADYIVIMNYDEHYKGSEAGSTASLSFVQKGIENTLAEVPASKVINALAFYTRLWKGDTDTPESETCSMAQAKAFVDAHATAANQMSWLVDEGQYYFEVELSDGLYRIWLENKESIEAKLTVMSQYSLAGVGCWKLGMETSDVWSSIAAYLAK